MKLIVDTNILFSFFKQSSMTRDIILSGVFELISPTHSKDELRKHTAVLVSRSKISKLQFESILSELDSYIEFVPLDRYADKLDNALKLTKYLSGQEYEEFLNDIDFFALALKEGCAIWSIDKLFKKQSHVEVFNTPELFDILRSMAEEDESSSEA